MGFLRTYIVFVLVAAWLFFSPNTQEELSAIKNLPFTSDKEKPIEIEPKIKMLDAIELRPSKMLDVSGWKESGFLTKNQLANWVLSWPDVDTIYDWSYAKDTDTIAKYYKTNFDSYYMCISNIFYDDAEGESHFIMEINNKGEVLDCNVFIHAFYVCTWTRFKGFSKSGDFYCFDRCNTGSAYCQGNLIFFKKLDHLSEPIPGSCWSGFYDEDNDLILNMEATFSIHGNRLNMIYDKKIGRGEYNKFKIHKRKKIVIPYKWENEEWIPVDSSLLNTIYDEV